MTSKLSILGAALALSAAFAAPALAEYRIESQGQLPSVVFVDFDEETEQRIASYDDQSSGSGGQRTVLVEGNDPNDPDATASVGEQPAEAPRSEARRDTSEEVQSWSQAGRAPTPGEIEKMIVEGEIEKRILDDANLR